MCIRCMFLVAICASNIFAYSFLSFRAIKLHLISYMYANNSLLVIYCIVIVVVTSNKFRFFLSCSFYLFFMSRIYWHWNIYAEAFFRLNFPSTNFGYHIFNSLKFAWSYRSRQKYLHTPHAISYPQAITCIDNTVPLVSCQIKSECVTFIVICVIITAAS